LVSSSPFIFFSKMLRLFEYIAIFADDVRDDERTI
jgi:hypothetical protein